MCELLTNLELKYEIQNGEFFLIGILSSLDIILDISLEEAIEQLPLNDRIKNAIIYREGLGGEALNCVLNYEFGNFNKIAFNDIPLFAIKNAYIESVNWVQNVTTNIKNCI